MYSVVLLAALTGGTATPAWWPPHYGAYCGYHPGHGWGCPSCPGGGYGGGSGPCGCWGGYGTWSYCNMPPPNPLVLGGYGLSPGAMAPGAGTTAPGPDNGQEDLEKTKRKKTGVNETMEPTSAKVLVELPANAKLFVDDMPVKAAPGLLTLQTPPLRPGEDYFYMVRIERMRDGQPLSETRRVVVRAGQVARADFKDLEAEAIKTAQAK